MGMTTRDEPKRSEESCGCHVNIRIESKGDVNIYNCTAPPQPYPTQPFEEYPCPPPVEGACLPVGLGAKPKQSRQRKLENLLAHNRVPSALAASFFHLSRRFLAGHSAANSLEESTFRLLQSLPLEVRGILSCAAASVDSLSSDQRNRIFPAALTLDPNVPLDPETFGTAFAAELTQRIGEQVFQDPSGVEVERPGLNRFFLPDSEIFPIQLLICRINGLRTIAFEPPLTPGDYLPEELERECEFVLVNGQPKQNCEVQKGGLQGKCPGNFLSDPDATCLRVPDVETGQAVVLEGVNFISVDATVRLAAQAPGTVAREVETHVFGDFETPLNEVVNGETRPIRNCRVHDRLTFRVPDDLPPGIYSIQIAMPNVSGIPVLGDPLLSNSEFIRVVPPPTARFTVSSERLTARVETAPARFGSDEVRVRISSFPVTASLTEFILGAEQRFDSPKFEDVDSQERRGMEAVLFSHQEPIAGMVMSVVGHEIDSDKAYEEQIDTFSEAFQEYLKDALVFAVGGIGAAGFAFGIKDVLKFGFKHPLVVAIAIAIALAVIIFLALWAPADLIIEDAIGPTTVELAELTNGNFPSPGFSKHTTPNGLVVNVNPLEKGPTQYSEFREYVSDDEESRYLIFYRYNRVA